MRGGSVAYHGRAYSTKNCQEGEVTNSKAQPEVSPKRDERSGRVSLKSKARMSVLAGAACIALMPWWIALVMACAVAFFLVGWQLGLRMVR
jgi:hypothetical protein